MPSKKQDDSRVISVRLPDDLIQRLDRYLDWSATSRRSTSTRHAAMREALSAWLDDSEQRAGLSEPQALRRQFQATSNSISPRHDGVSIPRLRQLLRWPRERFDAVLEALRAEHHIDLDASTESEVGPPAFADGSHVHGQLYGRLRWRD